jgi:hypothetical protein
MKKFVDVAGGCNSEYNRRGCSDGIGDRVAGKEGSSEEKEPRSSSPNGEPDDISLVAWGEVGEIDRRGGYGCSRKVHYRPLGRHNDWHKKYPQTGLSSSRILLPPRGVKFA